MRFFYDTEFIEVPGQPIHLLSIGMVDEQGREYYAINANAPLALANEWVRENVVPMLLKDWGKYAIPKPNLRNQIQAFLSANGPPELWGSCSDYDHVVLAQLFGSMGDWPKDYPHFTMDVKQWMMQLGVDKSDLPPQQGVEHHALEDARHCKEVWEFLNDFAKKRS